MSNYKAGDLVQLTIIEQIDNGYLASDNKMKFNLITEQLYNENDQVEAFLYHDSKNNLVATAKIPTVSFQTFDWAEVKRIYRNLGVFVAIGSTFEVLVSVDDLPQHQAVWPEVGDQLYVILTHDKKGRLLAQPVKEEDFDGSWDTAPESLFNQDISGRVFRSGKEGAVIISEDGYRGFIHYSERKEEPRVGEWVDGRVIEVKKDGTLNVSLLPRKQEARLEDSETILTYLKENNGEMSLDNQSSPEEIKATFDLSKSAFKRAIGKLYKDRLIKQEEGKTILQTKEADK
ncbi:MAG TPA: hypothetical protein GXZ58_04100 [Bacilli bacterium]|nr:hypothetical protein [Bacilli bacterium]